MIHFHQYRLGAAFSIFSSLHYPSALLRLSLFEWSHIHTSFVAHYATVG